MLERVFLYLKKSGEDTRFKKRKKDAECLIRKLRRHSVMGGVFVYDNIVCQNAAQTGAAPSGETAGQNGALFKGVLCIVDNSSLCCQFLRGGMPVIALLHEGNREQDFSCVRYAMEEIADIDYGYLERTYRRLMGLPWDIFETPRCLVREITPGDVDMLYDIYKEPSITEYMESLYADKEEEREYIRQYIKGIYSFYEYGMWVVIDKKTGKLIGRVGVEDRGEAEGLELGYLIAKPYQRQGFGSEACRGVLRYSAEIIGVKRIYSRIKKENSASIHFIRKLGFCFDCEEETEGQIYQQYVWCAEV